MKIHRDIDQNTEAWRLLRRGKITASEAGEYMIADPVCKLTKKEMQDYLDDKGIGYQKKDTNEVLMAKLPKSFILSHTRHNQTTIEARSKLYAKKLAERSGAEMLEDYAERVKGYMPEALATQYGHEMEEDARLMYQFVSGCDVEQVAFVEHDNGLCGCSPDGIKPNEFDADKIDGGVEIKCHLPPDHTLYRLNLDAFEAEHRHQVHYTMAITGAKWWDLFGYCARMPYIMRRVWRSAYTERFVAAIEEMGAEYEAAREQYNAIYAEQRIELARLKQEKETLSA